MTDQSIRAYVASKRGMGHGVVLALPVLHPREVLTAFDLCVFEAWTPRTSPSCCGPGSMQPYLCPTVRGARALLEAGFEGALAAVIPHTCDSMQGLGSIALDTNASRIGVVTFRHPRGGDRASARAFLRTELQGFIRAFEKLTGQKLAEERLGRAVQLHEQIDARLRSILLHRSRVAMSDAALYAVLRKREWMMPDEFASELEAIRVEPEPKQTGIPLVLSGMVPEPMELLDTIASAGGYVAVDDYAAIGRRLPVAACSGQDPIGTIVSRLLTTAPCPTRTADPWARVAWLRDRAKQAGARGAILHTVKFCDPELHDVPLLRRGLEEAGLKVLHLETELEPRLSGQAATRVEAFLEMLGGAS